MRTRKVITRSGARIRGKFPSAKMGKSVHWESLLERDACLLLEFSSGIRSYQEQPRKVQMSASGHPDQVQYPDFEITTVDGEVGYLEIKHSSQFSRPDVKAKLQLLQEQLEEEGYFYRVLTEVEIRRQPLLQNLWCLLPYRSPCIKPIHGDLANKISSHLHETTLNELSEILGSTQSVMTLLADQHWVFDLNKKLNPGTALKRNYGVTYENILL